MPQHYNRTTAGSFHLTAQSYSALEQAGERACAISIVTWGARGASPMASLDLLPRNCRCRSKKAQIGAVRLRMRTWMWPNNHNIPITLHHHPLPPSNTSSPSSLLLKTFLHQLGSADTREIPCHSVSPRAVVPTRGGGWSVPPHQR